MKEARRAKIPKTIHKKSTGQKRVVKHPEECESAHCKQCNTAFYKRRKTLLAKAKELNKKFDVQVLVVVTSRRQQNKLFSFSSEKFEPITTTKWGLRLFEDHLNPKIPTTTDKWGDRLVKSRLD